MWFLRIYVINQKILRNLTTNQIKLLVTLSSTTKNFLKISRTLCFIRFIYPLTECLKWIQHWWARLSLFSKFKKTTTILIKAVTLIRDTIHETPSIYSDIGQTSMTFLSLPPGRDIYHSSNLFIIDLPALPVCSDKFPGFSWNFLHRYENGRLRRNLFMIYIICAVGSGHPNYQLKCKRWTPAKQG